MLPHILSVHEASESGRRQRSHLLPVLFPELHSAHCPLFLSFRLLLPHKHLHIWQILHSKTVHLCNREQLFSVHLTVLQSPAWAEYRYRRRSERLFCPLLLRAENHFRVVQVLRSCPLAASLKRLLYRYFYRSHGKPDESGWFLCQSHRY